MTIRPVEATFFHADGQTDMTKLMVAFHNFANMPKNQLEYKDVDAATLWEVRKYVHIITTVAHLLSFDKFF